MQVSVGAMSKKSPAALRAAEQLKDLMRRHDVADAKALSALTAKIKQPVEYTTINRHVYLNARRRLQRIDALPRGDNRASSSAFQAHGPANF